MTLIPRNRRREERNIRIYFVDTILVSRSTVKSLQKEGFHSYTNTNEGSSSPRSRRRKEQNVKLITTGDIRTDFVDITLMFRSMAESH